VFESGEVLSRIFQEVKLTDCSGVVPVQFQYSNAVKGPEGPIAAPHPLAAHPGHIVAPAAGVAGSVEPISS
jgi:hypothetical protein